MIRLRIRNTQTCVITLSRLLLFLSLQARRNWETELCLEAPDLTMQSVGWRMVVFSVSIRCPPQKLCLIENMQILNFIPSLFQLLLWETHRKKDPRILCGDLLDWYTWVARWEKRLALSAAKALLQLDQDRDVSLKFLISIATRGEQEKWHCFPMS